MKKLSLLLAIVGVIFTIGCSKAPKTDIIEQVTDPHVRYESPKLRKWLKFEFINYIKRDDGLIEFEARFSNISSKNRNLSYKVQWKDQNGFMQKTLISRWIYTQVEARRNLVIHGISPSIKSSDFIITLQQPTKNDKLRKDSYHKRYSN